MMFLFFVLFIVYHISRQHMLKREFALKQLPDDFYIFKILDFIHVKNIWVEISKLIFILLGTIGFISALRLINFGKEIDIWYLFLSHKSNAFQLIFISIIFIQIYYYMHFMTQPLKDIAYRIHLYFNERTTKDPWDQNNKYFRFIDFLRDRYFTSTITSELSYATACIIKEDNGRFKSDSKIIIYLTKLCEKNPKLLRFFKRLDNVIENHYYMISIEESVYYYSPHIMVLIVFIYDMQNTNIKYIYYATFIFFIINIYRKVITFIGQADIYELDLVLTRYYDYGNLNLHKKMADEKERASSLISKYADIWEVYVTYNNMISHYFKRNYLVEYINPEDKKSYEPYSVRLLYVILFILYSIFCYNMSAIHSIVISLPLLLGIMFYEYAYFKYNKNKTYNIAFTMIYTTFLIIAILILVWIFLTRFTIFFINDVPWSYFITITQYFTVDEKLIFLQKYLMYKMKKMNMIDKLYLLKIIRTIPFTELLKSAKISEIKTFVDNLILVYITVEKNIYPSHKDALNIKCIKQLKNTWSNYLYLICKKIIKIYDKYV
jgi:hypothetical protein